MGVGTPEDLIEGVKRGVDMFDCVMPTRNGRNAMAFTDEGRIKIRNAIHERDSRPLQADIETPYSHLSRAYLRHLFKAKEMLGPILLSPPQLGLLPAVDAKGTRSNRERLFLLDFYSQHMAGWNPTSAPLIGDYFTRFLSITS